jgi:hypothetical protein
MRLRLFEAAIREDVPELERLSRLNMATREDYQAALSCEMQQGSTEAAHYLWKTLIHVGRDANIIEEAELPLAVQPLYRKTHFGCINFAAFVLAQADSKWIIDLARQFPEYLFSTLDAAAAAGKLWREASVYKNLMALVCYDEVKHVLPHGQADHIMLLRMAFLAALSASSHHPWQGVYADIIKLIDTPGIDSTDAHVLEACCAVDRHPGEEECATLRLLLSRRPRHINGDQSEEYNQDLFIKCFQHTTTDAPVHFLLDHWSDDNSTCTKLARMASQYGSCVALEACVDRISVIDVKLCECMLIQMATNEHTTHHSCALDRVMDRLLAVADPATVKLVRSSSSSSSGRFLTMSNHEQPHAMRLRLIEYLLPFSRHTPVNPIFRLDKEDFLWLFRRNPGAMSELLPHMRKDEANWAFVFREHQAQILAELLAHSSLAADVAQIVAIYT